MICFSVGKEDKSDISSKDSGHETLTWSESSACGSLKSSSRRSGIRFRYESISLKISVCPVQVWSEQAALAAFKMILNN